MAMTPVMFVLVVLFLYAASVRSSPFTRLDTAAALPTLDAVEVPHCSKGHFLTRQYWRTDVPEGKYVRPTSSSELRICWKDTGLEFSEHVVDANPRSRSDRCNAPVWKDGAALELFISRVSGIADVPREYYEIDISASGAVFGALIHSNNGTTTTCPSCTMADIGELPCNGLDSFTQFPELTHAIKNPSGPASWEVVRFIPFSMFDKFIAPADAGEKNKYFKINTYRYDFPHGIDFDYKMYELSGSNPTWSPSFHVPRRFYALILV